MAKLDKPGIPEKLDTPVKRAQYIFDVFKKTLEKGIPQDVVMEHGTSVQVLRHWIENGILPGRTEPEGEHEIGDLFVGVNPDAIPSRKHPSPGLQVIFPKDDIKEVSPTTYAEINAWKDFVMDKMGIPHSDAERSFAVQHLIIGDLPQGIVDKDLRAAMERILAMPGNTEIGLSPGSDMPKLIKEAKKRGGFRLGIRRRAITHFPGLKALAQGDLNEGDGKLALGDAGLPMQYLGSLIARNDQDKSDLGVLLREYLD